MEIKKATSNDVAFLISGSPNWARTSDLMINSHVLYQLSYRGTAEARILTKNGAGRQALFLQLV